MPAILPRPTTLPENSCPSTSGPLPVGRADRALAVVVLDVRAAEPARRDLDEDLVLGDRRLGDLLDPDVLRLVEDSCFHLGLTPLSGCGRACRAGRRARCGRSRCRPTSLGLHRDRVDRPPLARVAGSRRRRGSARRSRSMPLPMPRCVPNALCHVFESVSHTCMWPILPFIIFDELELTAREALLRLHLVVGDHAARPRRARRRTSA